MKLRKLKRDVVISIVGGKDLVGVYFADTDGSTVLLECSPEKADIIIGIWNNKGIPYGVLKFWKMLYGKK